MQINRWSRFLGVLAALAALMTSCGGGSDSSIGPTLIRIEADGLSQLLFSDGQPAASPVAGLRLNQRLLFSFGGRVDMTSLPGWAGWVPGQPPPGVTEATGSIAIFTDVGGVMTPARGLFEVADDPSLPAGNRRRVVFTPAPASDPANLSGSAGFLGAALYTICLAAGSPEGVVSIAGEPLALPARAQFATCDPSAATGSLSCFLDQAPGVPFVSSTFPLTADPPPLTAVPASLLGEAIRLVVSEALLPIGVSADAVRILNATTGGAVAGRLTFFQVGSPEAGPVNALLEFRPLNPLSPNQTYEIQVGAALQDFAGQPLALYDQSDPTRPASGRRLFRTAAAPLCPAAPFVEDFGPPLPGNPSLTIAGSGLIDPNFERFVGRFPFETIGDGSFGPLSFPVGNSTLDTGAATAVGFANGVWNATHLTLPAGANVRIVGTLFPAHIRCTAAATLFGTFNGSAGMSEAIITPIGSPEQGSRVGFPDQGAPTNNPSVVAGGVGGVGAGKGGDASAEGLNRTPRGQSGFGPAVNGVPDPGPASANPLTYGGGEGGLGDRRMIQQPSGGLGGAGGSAFAAGEDAEPRSFLSLGCLTIAPRIQPIATATGIPPVFVPPIAVQSAGSGGGGGGDRFDEQLNPATDDQGGSGGGGGGGFRLSCLGTISVGPAAQILMEGDSGSTGNVLFGGDGGGGSGGQIWLQTHSTLFVSNTARLSVAGGFENPLMQCGESQTSGAGGIGLIQLESPDPTAINTNFVGAGNGAHVLVFQLSSAAASFGALQATATSGWFDTGARDPDYLGTTSVITPNTAPCTGCDLVRIEFQGAFEDASGMGPDLQTATPYAAAGAGQSLDALDGRRFFRYRITLSFDLPIVDASGVLIGGTTPTTILPSVSRLEVQYATPAACP